MLKALDGVRAVARPNDLLIFTFAGHGMRDEGEFYLLTKEADPSGKDAMQKSMVSGAALRLKDRGLEPLVLEAESRVGGRMTTGRVKGFVIDRGVTLFGNGFGFMRALVKRLGLSPLVCRGKFSVGIQDAAGCRGYRGGRFDDLLFDRGISWRAPKPPSPLRS